MDYIDKEEKEIIESYENEEWVSSGVELKKEIRQAAKNSTLKNKRINIRLTEKDFKDIQVKAMEEGIPYQKLISSIIHKYNKGELKTDSE
ncbi:antitoxin [Rhodohalobacter barkolensis]|uniref:Antitoxin n=1 Tax=Rhodohalobacter barkolensis TaxID=2053187 RepID=A0A2N0VIC3_9BACT|nr:antitoxin [Rhodohalobacter barkolensis]PKD43914.1 antitoxin [Rhodohalobacter barkolensis]